MVPPGLITFDTSPSDFKINTENAGRLVYKLNENSFSDEKELVQFIDDKKITPLDLEQVEDYFESQYELLTSNTHVKLIKSRFKDFGSINRENYLDLVKKVLTWIRNVKKNISKNNRMLLLRRFYKFDPKSEPNNKSETNNKSNIFEPNVFGLINSFADIKQNRRHSTIQSNEDDDVPMGDKWKKFKLKSETLHNSTDISDNIITGKRNKYEYDMALHNNFWKHHFYPETVNNCIWKNKKCPFCKKGFMKTVPEYINSFKCGHCLHKKCLLEMVRILPTTSTYDTLCPICTNK